jgi:uncharacterized membrane protein
MKLSKYFTSKQLGSIRDAILETELNTTGEIRLHIENRCETDLLERTQEVFHALHMHTTEQRNGVLIYVALIDKKAAIIGDEGIDTLMPECFWKDKVDELLNYFKNGEYTTGLVNTIKQIGDKLQSYFPVESDDINELSDEISFYEN